MPHRRFAIQVVVAFLALYTIWGSTYLAIQIAGREVPPFLMAGTRFVVAGALLLAWCAASGTLRSGDLVRRHWLAAAGVGLGLMVIGNGGVAYAVQRIPTGISAVLVALTPVWLVLFDWGQRRGRRPGNAVLLGIALGIAGIVVLKLGDRGSAGTGAPLDLLGIAITVVATIGWAFGSIWGRTAPRAASPVTACAMQMLVGGLLLLAIGWTFEPWATVRWEALSLHYWLAWGYLVVFGSLCGFTAYIWLLQHVSAAKVGTYAYVNPIVALAIGAGWNGERLTATQFLACGLIVAGVVVITFLRGRNDTPPTPSPHEAREAAALAAAAEGTPPEDREPSLRSGVRDGFRTIARPRSSEDERDKEGEAGGPEGAVDAARRGHAKPQRTAGCEGSETVS